MCKSAKVGSAVCSVLGIALIGIGAGLIPFFHNYIHNQVKTTVPLKPDSSTFKDWVDPPVPIYFQTWVFDLLNPADVVKGSKPHVVQKGPYSYREHRHKTNITFNTNGTVSYRELRWYEFDQKMSNGSENDTFTTVNIPFMAIVSMMRFEYWWVEELVQTVLDWGNETLFIKVPVGGVLWGYEDPMLQKADEILQKFNKSIDDRFGLFYKQNGSDDGIYNIFTGVKDVSTFAVIDKWNYERSLSYWSTDTCNALNGTDGTVFPPFVDKSDILYLFSSDLCRSLNFVYENESNLKGIDLLRFSTPDNLFVNATGNPANSGFCVPSGNCDPSGVLNISSCKQGAPVMVSQPHFLHGWQGLIDAVNGMHPSLEEHSTAIEIEPMTGVAMNAAKKLQMNIFIDEVDEIRDTKNIKKLYYPILWLNESAKIDDKSADEFKSMLLTPIKITEAVEYGLIGIGGFILLCTVLFIIKRFAIKQKEEHALQDVNTSDRGGLLQS